MKTGRIYTLSNVAGLIIYVGSTTLQAEHRLFNHISQSVSTSGKLYDYMRTTKEIPTVEVLEEVAYNDISELRKTENYWIDQMRQWGFGLLNVCHNLNQSKKREEKQIELPMIPYLTTKEAGQMLKVSRGTLNNWRKTKKIKAKKIGRVVRYKLSDIQKAMK